MANFEYTAFNAQGEETSGVVSAASEAEVIQQLKAQGLYPREVVPAGKGSGKAQKSVPKGKKSAKKKGGKVKPKVLMIFTRQLATLIDSGLPLLRSLTVLGKQEPNPVLKNTIDSLAESVQTGATFSESLTQHPKIFNKLYINMVKAGELGGVLEVVLDRLAEYMEKANKLKNKIVSAMVYPVIVLFIAISILVFLMIFIVPKFREMFAEEGDLPAISQFVFGMSDWMLARAFVLPNVAWIFLVSGLVWMGLKAWATTTKGRHITDNMKLKLPVFGDLTQKSSIARFSRTLGTLVTSGVPILQALTITRDTSGNVIISEAIDKIHEAVKEGESIVTPMQVSSVFPSMVISMVDVGEETGQLPEMLLKIADVYDDEVDNAVTALTSIIEPLMIVFLAVVVGGIVFALFLPLIKMIQNVDQAG
ncbi:type II secretion system F family protein [Persicirhabdus sediminis]|uniref:General secretion pathway protein F n=1 Tax=Persicirhabdus sediminis TaxID=454144 RepID=A0A8J7MC03_9BACT|nr:type II secretion system F family protein [Persicirhabdus sediminis]MBK1790839.1 type II secretion system F family protein [Persicirhabdus sediminis]